MTDAITTDAVWATGIAVEFATSVGGNYLSQKITSQDILDEMVIAIRAGKLPVFVRGGAGMVERPARDHEPSFPVGDYWLRTVTARNWIASHIDTQAAPAVAESASSGAAPPKQRAQENRILALLNAQGYNPLLLPSMVSGKSGIKAKIRRLALVERTLFTAKTFDTAWQRVRDDGRISDGR